MGALGGLGEGLSSAGSAQIKSENSANQALASQEEQEKRNRASILPKAIKESISGKRGSKNIDFGDDIVRDLLGDELADNLERLSKQNRSPASLSPSRSDVGLRNPGLRKSAPINLRGGSVGSGSNVPRLKLSR